jgi:hypothetical protein
METVLGRLVAAADPEERTLCIRWSVLGWQQVKGGKTRSKQAGRWLGGTRMRSVPSLWFLQHLGQDRAGGRTTDQQRDRNLGIHLCSAAPAHP